MSEVAYLYKTDKVFKKLFNLMFSDFGWDATEIDKDIIKIWKIVSKLKQPLKKDSEDMDDLTKKIESILIKEFDVDWDKLEERLKVDRVVKKIIRAVKKNGESVTIWRICPKCGQVYNWLIGCEGCNGKDLTPLTVPS